MKAALQVVARHGYAMASVSRITEAAGVAQGTIYSYFENHQQLLQELLPSEGVRLLNFLGRDSHGAGDYFDHEKRAFLAFFKYLRRNPYFLRVLTEAEIAAPASHAEHMGNIEQRYLGALRRAQEEGQIRAQSDKAFRVLASVLSGSRGHIAIGLSAQDRSERPSLALEEAAETYIKFIRSGLGESTEPARLPSANAAGRLQRARRASKSSPSDTRVLLLRTAATIVHGHGFQAATVARVTSAANVAVGTFYAHFDSRQELLGQILDLFRTEMYAFVGARARGAKSFTEVEQRGFAAFFEYLSLNPTFTRVETEAAVWAPEGYAQHFASIVESYVASMRRSKAAGGLRAYDDRELPILACIFMAARHYISTRYFPSGTRPGRLPSYVAQTYLDLAQRGLQRR